MNKRYFVFSMIATISAVAILFSACRRINEATELGGGLIPPVDNINTFDTTIEVETFNNIFTLAEDSTRLGQVDEFFLGKITNDPIFGSTDARLFLQMKPANFPFLFRNSKDSLRLDSVVLILDYIETYGDTISPQTIKVYEIDQVNKFSKDSSYLVRQNNFTYSTELGSKTFSPVSLRDSVKAYGGDTTAKQLRIRLLDIFGNRLLSYDTLSQTSSGAFANDSIFNTKFKGFALQSVGGGNAIMGFNLAGANTKLAIYYKYDNLLPNVDTTVAYFNFGTLAAAASYIQRDYSGTPVLASTQNGNAPDPILYLQSVPGTYATVHFPNLGNVNNRVVHRAELVMEQIYDISDSLFPPPDYLYLDVSDPSITKGRKYRTVPYDLVFNSSGALNYGSFGVQPQITVDGSGNKIRTWKFNVSRYIQHVVNGTQVVYDLRLFPAFRTSEWFGIPPGVDSDIPIGVNPAIGRGRVRLGGGNHPTQKMKLRIIYSKL